jgi:hypothetical protein
MAYVIRQPKSRRSSRLSVYVTAIAVVGLVGRTGFNLGEWTAYLEAHSQSSVVKTEDDASDRRNGTGMDEALNHTGQQKLKEEQENHATLPPSASLSMNQSSLSPLVGAMTVMVPSPLPSPSPPSAVDDDGSSPSTLVRKVYVCGWPFKTLLQIFEPEYKLKPATQYRGATPNDILIYGMYGPCPELGYPNGLNEDTTVKFLSRFPGKILIANGEPYGNNMKFAKATRSNSDIDDSDGRWTRFFQIGPYPPIGNEKAPLINEGKTIPYVNLYNNHSLKVTYMAIHMSAVLGPPPGSNTALTTGSLNMDPSTIWTWLTDPTKRRNNTGLYSPAIAYLAGHCVPFRQRAAARLSDVVPVHYSPFGCKVESNNSATNSSTPRTMPGPTFEAQGTFAKNFVIFHDYKYCMVMENKAYPGYITEKIVNAFLGGCLPIYYGTTEIFDIFNKDSFIFYDIHNPQPALDLIQRLEDDPAEYHRMLQETPILKEGQRTMDKYFSFGWSVRDRVDGNHDGVVTLRDKIRTMMGIPL